MDARAICLAVLSMGDASGYEIRKCLDGGPFSVFSEAGYGSIYPALKRLSGEGLISGQVENQAGRPDKRVYTITQKGRMALLDILEEPPVIERFRSDHLFRLFFAHLMPIRAVEALLDERLAHYQEKIAHLRAKPSYGNVRPGADFVRGFGLALYEAAAKYVDDHRHELLAATAIEGETVADFAAASPQIDDEIASTQAAE